MLSKIKYIKIKDILGVIEYIILFIPSLILKLILIITNKKVWLVAELKDTCRDNGYHFFKYVKEKHPEQICFYAIDKKSKDYDKIKHFSGVIQFGSIVYWLLYLSANKNIVTDKGSDPCHMLFSILHKVGLYDNVVFLQHGIISNIIPMFFYKNTHFRLMMSGSKLEYELLRSQYYGYPENRIKYTGLARYDNLIHYNKKENQILIMPTWRRWIGRESNILGRKKPFTESCYYKKWSHLLNNKEFINYIEQNNLIIKFFPHHQMQKFLESFKTTSKNIDILDEKDNNVQTLLKESALLITDYSSVVYDFAYMRKPVLYYQFDFDEFMSKHFQDDRIDYIKNGYGDVCKTEEDLIRHIINFNEDFELSEKYKKRINTVFLFHDDKNCERIFNEIMKI